MGAVYNDELKEFYDRLKANGKHTTVAQVAVIKKMIVIAHALYVNNCAYDAVFYKKQCGVNTISPLLLYNSTNLSITSNCKGCTCFSSSSSLLSLNGNTLSIRISSQTLEA